MRSNKSSKLIHCSNSLSLAKGGAIRMCLVCSLRSVTPGHRQYGRECIKSCTCWASDILCACEGLQGCGTISQAFLQGNPTCYPYFSADLRLRMKRVWRDVADLDPKECNNEVATYQSRFASSLLDLQAGSHAPVQSKIASLLLAVLPRYLSLELSKVSYKHVMRNSCRLFCTCTLAQRSRLFGKAEMNTATRTRTHTHTHTHTHTRTHARTRAHTHTHTCKCLCAAEQYYLHVLFLSTSTRLACALPQNERFTLFFVPISRLAMLFFTKARIASGKVYLSKISSDI